MEEIHNLEMENSEKQAQIDRAIREKRAVESELEKVGFEWKFDYILFFLSASAWTYFLSFTLYTNSCHFFHGLKELPSPPFTSNGNMS